jgi:violaxanthin de-epoxidase
VPCAHCSASTLPREDIPELKAAAERAGLDWSKFTITNNSCPPHPPKAALPEKLRVAAVRRTAQAEYELENDLRSFGRGFTVLEKGERSLSGVNSCQVCAMM